MKRTYQVALQDFQIVPIDLPPLEDTGQQQIQGKRRNRQTESTTSAIYQPDNSKEQRFAFFFLSFYVTNEEIKRKPADKQESESQRVRESEKE